MKVEKVPTKSLFDVNNNKERYKTDYTEIKFIIAKNAVRAFFCAKTHYYNFWGIKEVLLSNGAPYHKF